MALPAFAAEHRRLQHGARSAPAAIDVDISCRQGPRQQTRRPPLLLSIDVTGRRTDRRTPNRYIDPVPHTMRAASIMTVVAQSVEHWTAVVPLTHRHFRQVNVHNTCASSIKTLVSAEAGKWKGRPNRSNVSLTMTDVTCELSPRSRRNDMPPDDGSSTRGGSTYVHGRVRSPHVAKLQAASVPIA